MTEFVTLRGFAWWTSGGAAGGPPTYSGATIAPAADDTDNGVVHALFSEVITSPGADYSLGFTLEARIPGGTWETVSVFTAALHGDGDKIIFTCTGVIDTYQATHEFRLSYDDGVGDIENGAAEALASFDDDDTLTNNSTTDLLTDIKLALPLNEVSGARVDLVAAHSFTDNNTVTNRIGVVSGAASFNDAATEYLSLADHVDLPSGDSDWTISCHAMIDDTSNLYGIYGRWSGSVNSIELFYFDTNDTWAVAVSSDGTQDAGKWVSVESASGISTAQWYHIIVRYNSTTDKVELVIDDTETSDDLAGGIFNSSDAFYIGAIRGVADSADFPLDGGIDNWLSWNRILTSVEETDLSNGGDFKTHPFLPTIDETLVFEDNFATSTTQAVSLHTPDYDLVGGGYTAYQVTQNVHTDGYLYNASSNSRYWIEMGESDVIITAEMWSGSYGCALMFRSQDTNNFWWAFMRPSTNTIYLYDVVAGSQTLRASKVITGGFSGSVYYPMTLTLSGTSITFTFDNNGEETTFTSSTFLTETRHGPYGFTSGSRWKKYKVVTA